MEQLVTYTRQQHPDYLDNLLPGYRFCPTDSELILYYLTPMIETGQHPQCRMYEVNIYKYNPEELTNWCRACDDDKWYFLTPLERKYQNGDRPNRRTGNYGFWKTTQKYTSVYHHDASGRRVVGTKRSLAYHDDKGCKTSWLMQEFSTSDPNLPIQSRQGDNKVLTDWVLCKIYKKKGSETDNTTIQAPQQGLASGEVGLPLTNSTTEFQQIHSMSTPNINFQLISHGAPADSITNSSQHSDGSSNFCVPMIDDDHIFQPDGLSTTRSVVDEENKKFHISEWFSIDEFMSSQFEV